MSFKGGVKILVNSLGLDYCDFIRLFDAGVDMSIKQTLTSLFTSELRKHITGKTCVIFGAGQSGILVMQIIKSRGWAEVSGFIDNNVKGEIEGLPVRHPRHADWHCTIIISASPPQLYSVFQSLKRYTDRQIEVLILWDTPFIEPGVSLDMDLGRVIPDFPGYLGYDAMMAGANETDEWGWIKTVRDTYQFDSLSQTCVLPLVKPDGVVVEIGPGIGQFTRSILKVLTRGELHLFEIETWWRDYLPRSLKAGATRVISHDSDGKSLKGVPDAGADMVFAGGVFDMLPSALWFNYFDEAARVLRGGGWLVFNFHDTDNPEAFLGQIKGNLANDELYVSYMSFNLVNAFLSQRGLEFDSERQYQRFYHFRKIKE